jgi:hypothetical protein
MFRHHFISQTLELFLFVCKSQQHGNCTRRAEKKKEQRQIKKPEYTIHFNNTMFNTHSLTHSPTAMNPKYNPAVMIRINILTICQREKKDIT